MSIPSWPLFHLVLGLPYDGCSVFSCPLCMTTHSFTDIPLVQVLRVFFLFSLSHNHVSFRIMSRFGILASLLMRVRLYSRLFFSGVLVLYCPSRMVFQGPHTVLLQGLSLFCCFHEFASRFAAAFLFPSLPEASSREELLGWYDTLTRYDSFEWYTHCKWVRLWDTDTLLS